MRWTLACIALVFSAAVSLTATPTPPTTLPPRQPLSQAEAQQYAQQLSEIVSRVAVNYIRPVEPAELVGAALRGLYEAADVPLPPQFRSELQRAASSREPFKLALVIRESLGNPEPLRGQGAILASLRALARSLDPYCAVVTGAEFERINSAAANAANHGFGLEILGDSEIGPLLIRTVLPGGPAQKAGLRPGDQIMQLDGRLIGDKLSSASGKGDSPSILKGTVPFSGRGQLRLTVSPLSSKNPREILLRAERFRTETVLGVMRRLDNSWDYFLDREHRIAFVRIASLDYGTTKELMQVLENLQDGKMRGLILDLRWCPGGFLQEAREIADLFRAYNLAHFMHPAPGNLLTLADPCLDNHWKNAVVHFRGGEGDYPVNEPKASFANFPIVVLVNAQTSGGAELIAAVLQDNKRASIAGQRTRGKASVQSIFRLNGEEPRMLLSVPIPGTALKLTNGLLVRPSGKNLNRFPDSKPTDEWGVRPDPKLEFLISTELNRQLRDWWQLQNLRPGPSNESLPLDDPAKDPQRQAALQTLLDLVK